MKTVTDHVSHDRNEIVAKLRNNIANTANLQRNDVEPAKFHKNGPQTAKG